MTRRISFFTLFVLLSHWATAQSRLPDKPGEYFLTTSDHIKIYVRTTTRNKPVCIFIHGGPGAWSRSFEDLGGSKLEAIFSMVYYDQRGCGRSDTSADYSLLRMVSDIHDIQVGLNAGEVYIMGHSFGGILATEYAKKYPKSVKGLILLNCTLDIDNSLTHQIMYVNELAGSHISVDQENIVSHFFAARNLADSLQVTYKIISDNKSSVDSLDKIDQANPGGYHFGRAAWKMPEYFQDFSLQTPQIQVPVLIITGDKDHSIGPEHYKKFHFPDQKVVHIDGGHILYYDNSSELLSVVKAWYNSHS